jgi:hypothetical protein
MNHLRVVMQPIRRGGPGGRAIVGGFELDFSRRGVAVAPPITDAALEVELSCVLITKIREDERTDPEPFATLTGTLSCDATGTLFSLDETPPQNPPPSDVVEQDGHRRPRRKLTLKTPDGTEVPLFFPDSMQVPFGFVEVTAKLTVNGELHADAEHNDTLDVPLLPLRLTHAIFNFVDGDGQPLRGVNAEYEDSNGEQVSATTDDFGDVYLDAQLGQTYSLVQVLPADDDRVAVVETSVSGDNVAVA